MSKHTKGPWSLGVPDVWPKHFSRFEYIPVGVYSEKDCDIHAVADCSCNASCRNEDEAQANAKRIVAAVNFCEGFSNDELAKMERLRDVYSKYLACAKAYTDCQSITPPKDKT